MKMFLLVYYSFIAFKLSNGGTNEFRNITSPNLAERQLDKFDYGESIFAIAETPARSEVRVM
jgi:hypothetical protein